MAIVKPGTWRSCWRVLPWLLIGAAAHAADPAELERGKRLFNTVQPPCAACHTLAAAGAEGQVGPVLDELKPDAARVLRALRSGIGIMPSFAERLSEQDLRALARFVAHATGGAPLPGEH